MKKKITAKVLKQEELTNGIYSLYLEVEDFADAHSGQFVMIYPGAGENLLGRPISLCEVSGDRRIIRLVYRVAGAGTYRISHLKENETVQVLGPLGNGYDMEIAGKAQTPILMGGGIGIPPMLQLAKDIYAVSGRKPIVLLGYRDRNLFLADCFEETAQVIIATEDGSVGTKGNVMDALREKALNPDMICACGPMPMLRAIKNYAVESDIKAYISLEERMACGVGACLGCVTKTAHIDDHSKVNNARVCTEGPVFEAREVLP